MSVHWGGPQERIRLARLAAVALILIVVAWWPSEARTGACEVILPHADLDATAVRQGWDYTNGVWTDGNTVIGYAITEDSEITTCN
jgi:hypothetical protein